MSASVTDWAIFATSLGLLLAIDLFTHRKGREQSRQAAVAWSVAWIGAGLLFGVYVWHRLGARPAGEYLAAYLIEKSLSVDNLFVFMLVFQSLQIPRKNQHTVLLWGILGALAFRGLAIFAGVAALERFSWVVYVFGGILLLAALHAWREDLAVKEESKLLEWLSRHLPVKNDLQSNKFFERHAGRLMVTPLLLALLTIEATDIVFAIDSVPAALSVTRERFVVYSSNAFAILGLRSLYLVLARTIASLRYLHYGLAIVLAFAGVKMIAQDWFHIPPLLSVSIIALVITVAVLASLRGRHKRAALIRERQAAH